MQRKKRKERSSQFEAIFWGCFSNKNLGEKEKKQAVKPKVFSEGREKKGGWGGERGGTPCRTKMRNYS